MPNDFYSAYNSLSTARKKEAYDFVLFLLDKEKKHTKRIVKSVEKKVSKKMEIAPITKSLSGVINDDGRDYKEVIAEAIIEDYENESVS